MIAGLPEPVRRHARAPDLACCRTFQKLWAYLVVAAAPAASIVTSEAAMTAVPAGPAAMSLAANTVAVTAAVAAVAR